MAGKIGNEVRPEEPCGDVGPKAHAAGGFQFDTRGEVWLPGHVDASLSYPKRWPDLSPFAQGTMTAAARGLQKQLMRQGWDFHSAAGQVAFRNWHPETLAAMLKDCAEVMGTWERLSAKTRGYNDTAADGERFYVARQRGDWAAFPALTLYIEDGKVRHRVAS